MSEERDWEGGGGCRGHKRALFRGHLRDRKLFCKHTKLGNLDVFCLMVRFYNGAGEDLGILFKLGDGGNIFEMRRA